MENIKNEEQRFLDEVLKKVSFYLEEELDGFDDLEFKYRRDPEKYGIAYRTVCDNIRRYKSAIEKPYFARIDFKTEKESQAQTYYIGKYGISDDKSSSIILDWRAPISSLYYDSEIGQTSYECPEGTISGNLDLKRQYEIEQGKLLSYHDVDLVSNDDLLQKYLHENNDMRLKNIVSTIQSEQNVAIRRSAYKDTIIQGVAGSGKTTIALHRIAYLVYNYRNTIRNNQYMVIGPNDVFLKYIESVLPDLDVTGIEQLTIEKLAREIVDEDFTIKPSSKQLTQYLSGKSNNNIEKIKNSEQYLSMIDEFLDKYIDTITDDDLKIDGFIIIPKNKVKNIFELSLKDSYTFKQIVDRFILLVSKYIEDHSYEIKNRFSDYINTIKALQNGSSVSKQMMQENYNKESVEFTIDRNILIKYRDEKKLKEYAKTTRENIEKGCKNIARKYISKYKDSPQKIYELFINDLSNSDKSSYKEITELCKETKENLKKSNYDFEDLAALMYIKSRLGLPKYFKEYKHIVIDEAQDLGKADYIALKSCMPNAYFSIYGDIAQSIYDYRSIDSWNDIKDIFPESELMTFKKSYRTTDQIMTVANSVSEIIGLDSSELSVRQGRDVTFNKVDNNSIPTYIIDKLTEYKKKEYKTIAIISKYPTQSSYINDDLSFEGLVIPNIDESKDITSENGGIFTIPSYLAKGLEFDAVILNNVDEKIYNSDSQSDMKLLYVSSTRALHEMDVIYTDEITKPFKKFIKDNNKEKKIGIYSD